MSADLDSSFARFHALMHQYWHACFMFVCGLHAYMFDMTVGFVASFAYEPMHLI